MSIKKVGNKKVVGSLRLIPMLDFHLHSFLSTHPVHKLYQDYNIMIRLNHRFFFINFCNKVIASGEILCASLSKTCDSKLHLFIFKYSVAL